ncbi:multidrug resistance-associated ABC transporter [Ramaria rubella]|nr:multidrug resistance-associated ABC transporter [Ramaria rubella]
MYSVSAGSRFWTDDCTRSYFQSLPPFIFITFVGCLSIPLPAKITGIIPSAITPFLPLEEAQALLDTDSFSQTGEPSVQTVTKPEVPLWRTICLSSIALGETICWVVIASHRLVLSPGSMDYRTISPLLNFLSWLPVAVIPVLRPKVTPPFDLFIFYMLQLFTGIFRFGTIWYDHNTLGLSPSIWDVVATTANLVLISVLLLIVLRMPLNIPSDGVLAEKIGKEVSPEDYTPLWCWITFKWIYPLIKKGRNETLNEPDVWELSPTMRCKAVYLKFAATRRKTLIRRLWAANSFDMILDFLLTLVSVLFYYAGPFFLKRILESLDPAVDNDPEARSRAYIYAFLAFLSTVCKAEADIHHLWFARRAGTQLLTELMASIYAKALVRKDYSGHIDSKVKKESEDRKHNETRTRSTEPPTSARSEPNGNGKKSKHKIKEPRNTSGADTGKIVNLMSGDANRVALSVNAFYFVYGAPFEIAIASVFLYQLLGLSAFVGLFCLGVVSPLGSFLTKRSIRIEKGLLAARDKRMGVVNELLNAVKLIKFYGWETLWIDRVLDARKFELKWLVKSKSCRINHVMFLCLSMITPIMVSVVSFFTFVMTGHELTVPVAFTAIALFSMLRTPLTGLPSWIVLVLQTGVVLDRIATFLSEDEVPAVISSLNQGVVERTGSEDLRLGIEDASFKWNEVDEAKKDSALPTKILPNPPADAIEELGPTSRDSVSITAQAAEERHFELRDINVIFPEGKLTIVTGPTASGKTALLMALLGEMTMQPGSGKLLLPKYPTQADSCGFAGLSYAAQAPFLQHQTIRDNILFGTPYDKERYEAVLESCALNPDLEILEDGDLTEVGSRGISLSGGQKTRVALARAVYARSKCVLLDDPLSAVDSHTALFLFEHLFKGPLLANRTVVLVTHNVELVLPGAYYLVRLLDGRINIQGTTEELRERGVLDAITKESSLEQHVQAHELPQEKVADAEGATKVKTPRQLVKDEARETGSVKWSIYKTYMKASSYWTWIILAISICLYQLGGVAEKLWIKRWGEAYNQTAVEALFSYSPSSTGNEGVFVHYAHSSAHFSGTIPLSDVMASTTLPSADAHPLFYVAIYAAISFGAAAIGVTNAIVQYAGGLRASRLMFKQLLVAIMRATMRWHDSTPTGRMLNRLSKDIETVDTSLGSSLQSVNSSIATFFASVATVIFFSPPFILPAVIFGSVYYRLGVGYLNTGRDLRRMESNSRSPIFSNFSELLSGIVTVRAFSSERRFLENLYTQVDTTGKVSFWMTSRWLLLRYDILGGLAVLFTTLLALSGAIGAGVAGVTITSAMGFTSAVYWTCRFWTQLELDLKQVVRVVEYLEIPQEPPGLIESNSPPAYWPSSTNNDALIEVEDLVVRYAPELPAVLHGVSFSLKARERVGLLGRTGDGKSTLAMSLLRFTDPSSGSIRIDGIDISTIGLHDLRSRLTFVAQDAVLFSGTIRENIDPFADYSDEECLDALARVHLLSNSEHPSKVPSRASSIHNMQQEEPAVPSSTASDTLAQDDKQGVITLDTQVSAGGANFSQGQRQLLTMARALLRQSSIIILDEATSSIDYVTDAKIQTTIREEFKNSLLLTIAHRLRTVIDYDRLIILDNGRIVEFDTPHNLIHKEGGAFRDMCIHSGTYKELEEAANSAAVATA